ncbi:hypothetical protein [Bdellovibrio sp. HCB209]|uniref:hypothetical protein n=1 Tax=Bdellovibrio sp. HCB209 TaxID=3394354 RepID=UPI0039B4EFB2
MIFVVISSVVAILIGVWVRHVDVDKKKNTTVDRRKLTPLQIVYSACFAYPFCAIYVWLENLL